MVYKKKWHRFEIFLKIEHIFLFVMYQYSLLGKYFKEGIQCSLMTQVEECMSGSWNTDIILMKMVSFILAYA